MEGLIELRRKIAARQARGWLLVAIGLILLWLWQNFPETFGGIFYVFGVAVQTTLVLFLAGVASLIGGALLAQGGWGASVWGLPIRYPVGLVVAGVVSTTAVTIVRPGPAAKIDSWLAFQTLRRSLDALDLKVPRGATLMECNLALEEPQAGGRANADCEQLFAIAGTQRHPADDSLFAVMVEAGVRGFLDVEMRRSYLALVRTRRPPGIRAGFLKLHPEHGSLPLPPAQLFLHDVADAYPMEDGWFHFVTR